MALVGFDDLTICRFTQPSLSTVHFSPGELAGLAFRALLEEIQEGDSKKSQFEYKTRFVLRESTCAPNH
jgi:DNA-binding LacI/PurR family transcriptional regulator